MRSQIKVRYNKKNEEITVTDIDKYKQKSKSLSNQFYTYGQKRFNYVNPDKRFKTTVSGNRVPNFPI